MGGKKKVTSLSFEEIMTDQTNNQQQPHIRVHREVILAMKRNFWKKCLYSIYCNCFSRVKTVMFVYPIQAVQMGAVGGPGSVIVRLILSDICCHFVI